MRGNVSADGSGRPDAQVRRAILWLRDERADHLRYAAALVLRQLAENAPAVFNVHVKPFIEVIWSGLRDSKVYVREASVDALRVRHADPWHDHIGTVLDDLGRSPSCQPCSVCFIVRSRAGQLIVCTNDSDCSSHSQRHPQ